MSLLEHRKTFAIGAELITELSTGLAQNSLPWSPRIYETSFYISYDDGVFLPMQTKRSEMKVDLCRKMT